MPDPISQDTRDALEMIGLPIVQYETPGQQTIETEAGLETVETLGWVKFSTAFRKNFLSQLKGAKLSVFISISLHVNNQGRSFPGIKTIAKDTGYSRDEVMETIAELEAIPGLLIVSRQMGRKNVYLPAFVSFGKNTKPVVVSPTGSGFPLKPVVVKRQTSSGFPDSKKIEEESIKEKYRGQARAKDPRSAHPAIQAFREVTQRYPPKVNFDRVIASLSDTPDLEKLKTAFEGWCARGYNPANLNWLDWYRDGVPQNGNGQHKTSKGNGFDVVMGYMAEKGMIDNGNA